MDCQLTSFTILIVYLCSWKLIGLLLCSISYFYYSLYLSVNYLYAHYLIYIVVIIIFLLYSLYLSVIYLCSLFDIRRIERISSITKASKEISGNELDLVCTFGVNSRDFRVFLKWFGKTKNIIKFFTFLETIVSSFC